jgi:hypothetical protein
MDFRDTLARRESFTTSGALRGVSGPPMSRWGRLDYEARESVSRADYVVYSYSTPIAWHIPDVGWIENATRYSVTTSRHQSKIFTAIDQLGE